MSLDEKPGPTGEVGTGPDEVCREANQAHEYTVPEIDAIAALGLRHRFGHPDLRDALCLCDAEHRIAPKKLLDRIYGVPTPDTAGRHLVHAARVTFHARWKFQLNPDGDWAVVIPIFDGGEIIDVAAFDPDDPTRRGVLLGSGFCVNIDEAQFEARHDGIMRVHLDPWSFLRAGCDGALPLDWLLFALELKKWKLDAGAESAADAELIAEKLEEALKPPSVFVRQHEGEP